MSRQAAARFLGQVRSNPDLQKKLGSSPTAEGFIQEGTRAGLTFTAEELKGVSMAERFLQKTIDDPTQYRLLQSMKSSDSMAQMAQRLGFECGPEDIDAVLSTTGTEGGELSSEELASVAGGFTTDYTKVPAPPAPYAPVPYPSGW